MLFMREMLERARVLYEVGYNKEDKVDTGNIISIAYQIATIVISIAILYGVQRWLSKPIDGDEEKRDTMEKARALRREARQRSLELLMGSNHTDLSLTTTSSFTAQEEKVMGSRALKENRSREKEILSSTTELAGRPLPVNRGTEGGYGIAQGC